MFRFGFILLFNSYNIIKSNNNSNRYFRILQIKKLWNRKDKKIVKNEMNCDFDEYRFGMGSVSALLLQSFLLCGNGYVKKSPRERNRTGRHRNPIKQTT
jgi:hypothetical protein